MTEAEWLACTDPTPMLEYVRGKASDRKLRLFARACCRRIWHLLNDLQSRQAVEAAERFADGVAKRRQLHRANRNAHAACETVRLATRDMQSPPYQAAWAAQLASGKGFGEGSGAAVGAAWFAAEATRGKDVERDAQVAFCRDLFGSLPFRSVTLDPMVFTWNGGTVPKLAQAIYGERRFGDLPILADALEEAGCSDQDILSHCRSEGPHVRGCWVVDLLLGKA
jgi:hypothetical protein